MTTKVGELSACYGQESKKITLGNSGNKEWLNIEYGPAVIQVNPKQLRELFLLAIEVWGREYMIKVLNGEKYA